MEKELRGELIKDALPVILVWMLIIIILMFFVVYVYGDWRCIIAQCRILI